MFFPTSLCGVLVFGFALPPASSSSCRRLPPPHTKLIKTCSHTHNLSKHSLFTHNLLTHNLLTPNLSTHSLLTPNLSTHTTCSHPTCPHTTCPHTHNLLTHNLLTHNLLTPNLSTHSLLTPNLSTHTTCSHTLLTHNLLPPNLFTHNLLTSYLFTHTHNLSTHSLFTNLLSHTQLAHTQLVYTPLAHTQLVRTQLAHTQLVHAQLVHTQLAHTQLTHTQLAPNLSTHSLFTHNLYSHTHIHAACSQPSRRGRRAFCEAGVSLVALGWLWWGAWVPFGAVVAAAVSVAGVALGDSDMTSTCILRGRCRTYGTGLALVARLGPVWRRCRRLVVWQAWRLATSTFTLRGRCGTWRHRRAFCVALMARAGSGGALGSRLAPLSPRLLVWQAWHLVTSTFTLCGRSGSYGTGLALVARLGPG